MGAVVVPSDQYRFENSINGWKETRNGKNVCMQRYVGYVMRWLSPNEKGIEQRAQMEMQHAMEEMATLTTPR